MLRPGGHYCITDLRRDMNPVVRWFLKTNLRPKQRRAGFLSSLRASYVVPEIRNVLARTKLPGAEVHARRIVLVIRGAIGAASGDIE